jgi:hypothetical protein
LVSLFRYTIKILLIQQMLGAAASTAAGRLAHHFNTGGPSLCVDTACSSGIFNGYFAINQILKAWSPWTWRLGPSARAVAGGRWSPGWTSFSPPGAWPSGPARECWPPTESAVHSMPGQPGILLVFKICKN